MKETAPGPSLPGAGRQQMTEEPGVEELNRMAEPYRNLIDQVLDR
jgi:hypothetical protein